MKEIIIGKNDEGGRIDRFLMKVFPDLPKGMLYKAIRNKKIKVNRKRCTIDQRLQSGDCIQLFLPPQLLEERKHEYAFLKVPKQLTILYEDDQLLILDKPVGLRSQSDQSQTQDCVVTRLWHYLYAKGEYDPQQEQSFAPAICNRLDRNTRGLIIVAKTMRALRSINGAIQEHQIKKYYVACVEGTLAQRQGTIQLYHKKEGTTALLFSQPQPGTTRCSLRYRVWKQFAQDSLVEIELISGKFHQIRAMFAYLHHPLIGDVKYGAKRQNMYQALAAYRLCFDLPKESDFAYLNEKKIQIPVDQILGEWQIETNFEK